MFRVALTQLCSSSNSHQNLLQCRRIMEQIFLNHNRQPVSSSRKVDAVFFPEACDWIGNAGRDIKQRRRDSAMFLRGMQELAGEFQVHIFTGLHFHSDEVENSTELGDYADDGGKMYNSHVVIDPHGSIKARYDKVHLFDYEPAGLKESQSTYYGNSILRPVEIGIDSLTARVGLAVCYDLRFPELSQALTLQYDANILSFPSAFTLKTGRMDHWSLLLRARAVETQSFVIASAQMGQHDHAAKEHDLGKLQNGNSRKSWGQSMIVDPLGRIVVQLGSYDNPDSIIRNDSDAVIIDIQSSPEDQTSFAIVDLEMDAVNRTRQEMPMHLHRRSRHWQPQ